MATDLPSLLGDVFSIENGIRLACGGLGVVFTKTYQFAYSRWLCPAPHPETARRRFRRQARHLVLWAFLAGRRSGVWFWILYYSLRAGERHVLNKVRELRELADPVFILKFTDLISDALCCEDDGVYHYAGVAVARELQVLERFAALVPADMPHLRCLICACSKELAEGIQALYECRMSQHPELALDDSQQSQNYVSDCVKSALHREIASLRRLVRCLGRKLVRMLEQSRADLGYLVNVHQPQTNESTADANLPAAPLTVGQELLPPTSRMLNLVRVALVVAALAFLVVVGLEVAQLCMLSQFSGAR